MSPALVTVTALRNGFSLPYSTGSSLPSGRFVAVAGDKIGMLGLSIVTQSLIMLMTRLFIFQTCGLSRKRGDMVTNRKKEIGSNHTVKNGFCVQNPLFNVRFPPIHRRLSLIKANTMKHNFLTVYVLIGCITFCSCSGPQEKEKTNETAQDAKYEPTNEELIARGKYLTLVSGCHDCHSPKVMTEKGPELDTTRLLAGHPQ